MKKIINLIIASLIFMLIITTISLAATKTVISSVLVTDIEAPFSENRQIDTEGKVPNDAKYRITNIAWENPNESLSGYYQVTVTLKANIGYIFSGDTVGTVNGENIFSKRLIKEDELNITYAFDENSSTSSTINNATSSKRYRITVYSNTNKGTITPSVVRVLEGNSQTFKITPKEGYKILDVRVDGESIGAVSEYTFKRVKTNHSISASFEEIKVEEVEDTEKLPENVGNKPLLSILLAIFRGIV